MAEKLHIDTPEEIWLNTISHMSIEELWDEIENNRFLRDRLTHDMDSFMTVYPDQVECKRMEKSRTHLAESESALRDLYAALGKYDKEQREYALGKHSSTARKRINRKRLVQSGIARYELNNNKGRLVIDLKPYIKNLSPTLQEHILNSEINLTVNGFIWKANEYRGYEEAMKFISAKLQSVLDEYDEGVKEDGLWTPKTGVPNSSQPQEEVLTA